MVKLSDDELLNEIRQRFNETKNSLTETERLMIRLKEVNKKLEESEALKSNFLSNIRNEINNPLSSIMGLARSIYAIAESDPETVVKFASTIYRESFNLDFQLKNIFTSAELEGGECFVTMGTVSVRDLLTTVVETFRHISDEKQIRISVKTGENGPVTVHSDVDKLHLIFSNLIDNAIEYGAENSQVTVSCEQSEEKIDICVQNFGDLINQPNRNVIFDRFKQLETGSTKRHKGHGLGLSLTRDLLEMIGGSIHVESDSKRGNRFYVTLPKDTTELTEQATGEGGDEVFFDDVQEL